MRTILTISCLSFILLLTSCSKETFHFTNTGTSYGSMKAHVAFNGQATTGQNAATTTDLAASENKTASETFTASTAKTVVLSKNDIVKTKALYHKQAVSEPKKQNISKAAQVKAAIKLNREVKPL
jgi:hypothetical protein